MRHTLTWYTLEDDGYPRSPEVVMPSAFDEGSDLLWEWLDAHAVPVFVWIHHLGELCPLPAPAYWAGMDDGFFLMREPNRRLKEEDIAMWAYYPTLESLQNEDEQVSATIAHIITPPQLDMVRKMVGNYDATRSANMREQFAAQLVGMLKIVYGIDTAFFEGGESR